MTKGVPGSVILMLDPSFCCKFKSLRGLLVTMYCICVGEGVLPMVNGYGDVSVISSPQELSLLFVSVQYAQTVCML